MILYIDGTDYTSVTYALGDKGGVVVSKKYTIDPHESHETLKHLEKFLKQNKIELSVTSPNPSFERRGIGTGKPKISRIVVNKGPGSFTGTRIGVAHAMALGLAWKVPVKAVGKEKFLIK